MLSITQIEEKLQIKLSEEKKQEILDLEENISKSKNNLEGKIFNRLLVLGRGPNYISPGGKKNSQWWCICNCDNQKILLVRISNLTSGNTKSCGCLNLEKKVERIKKIGSKSALDLRGKVFGCLTAIEPTDDRANGSVIWKCICSCGKIKYAQAKELNRKRNGLISCGHLNESRGVLKISQFLEKYEIEYIKEKTFSTCKFPDTNASARFDFFLPKYNYLIEYDGEQHYEEKDLKYFRDSLKKRQEHDDYKNKWCKNNNYKLIRIPYWDYNNIDNLLKKELS